MKKAVNKRTLFPLDKNSYSTSKNEGFIKKIRFHYAEICFHWQEHLKKSIKWFSIVKERFLYKKWLYLKDTLKIFDDLKTSNTTV